MQVIDSNSIEYYSTDLLIRITKKLAKRYHEYINNSKEYDAGLYTADGYSLDHNERPKGWRRKYQEMVQFCSNCQVVINAQNITIIGPYHPSHNTFKDEIITNTIKKCLKECERDIEFYYESAMVAREMSAKERNELSDRSLFHFETADCTIGTIELAFETKEIEEVKKLIDYLSKCKYSLIPRK